MPEYQRSSDMILHEHIQQEEANARASAARMERIEEDLRPLKKMYYAVIGSGGVLVLLLATLLYIYDTDKGNITTMQKSIRETQDSIIRQGAALEKMLYMHQELEKDLRKDLTRLEARRGH